MKYVYLTVSTALLLGGCASSPNSHTSLSESEYPCATLKNGPGMGHIPHCTPDQMKRFNSESEVKKLHAPTPIPITIEREITKPLQKITPRLKNELNKLNKRLEKL